MIQARGFLMERGIHIGSGRHFFQRELTRLLESDEKPLMSAMVRILSGMAAELTEMNERVAALVAAIGDGIIFTRARDLSAWLRLVSRQITTGGKARLIGISKHGYSYLRKLFIHSARTILHLVRDSSTPLARWIDALKERAHANVVGVAMANKLARISWAVLTKGERFRPGALATA